MKRTVLFWIPSPLQAQMPKRPLEPSNYSLQDAKEIDDPIWRQVSQAPKPGRLIYC